MSYDLYFWKQSDACRFHPQEVVDCFINREEVVGLERLPTEDVIRRLNQEFCGIVENVHSDGIQLIWDDANDGCFIASPNRQYLCIESHQATTEVLNRLIDIAAEFHCRLFDPQTGVRYTSE